MQNSEDDKTTMQTRFSLLTDNIYLIEKSFSISRKFLEALLYCFLVSFFIDHSLNNNVVPSEPGKNREKGDVPRNNNEEPCSHGNLEATTVEVENNLGVNNASLVSAEVIQLLDALLNRIEMKSNAQVEFAES